MTLLFIFLLVSFVVLGWRKGLAITTSLMVLFFSFIVVVPLIVLIFMFKWLGVL